MHLSRRVVIQLALFAIVSLAAAAVMIFGYMDLPRMFFNSGHYKLTVEMPAAAGLYPTANVTYRGTEVGRVESVDLGDTGVVAVLSMNSDIKIPADLDAQVHSQSAIGEQYILLLPRSGNGPVLKNGDVIPMDRTSVPPDINSLLDATNTGIEAIPNDNVKTLVDEAYTAIGGLGPEISRIVKGSTTLAIDSRKNLDALTSLIDTAGPVLDSQADTADSINSWAASMHSVAGQLRDHDQAVRGVLQSGPGAADEVRALFDRVNPTLPVLLANMVSLGEVAVTYQPNIEQLLVLVPQGVAQAQAITLPNHNTKQAYKGLFMSFNLNLNLPGICNTGFLPASQRRAMADDSTAPPPPGGVYCRVPQDSPNNVRGARNYPCVTKPGKRAPTARMCESDEQYVPLNDGYNWKGDPNATLSGVDVPDRTALAANSPVPPPPAAPPVPIAAATYDPASGSYIGPDGQQYTQSDLGNTVPTDKNWQSLLLPPTGGH